MKLWLAGLSIFVFTHWSSTASLIAAEPYLEKVDVFPPKMNGIAVYRIPGIVITERGTVLAYCEARKNSKSDWGEIEVHLRRSNDGGKTWLPSQNIAHRGPRIEGNPRKPKGGEHEQTVNNPVAIVNRDDGSITMLYCVNYARCFSMRSLDDGLTWNDPVEITETFEAFRSQYDWKVIATGPGHGIQLRNGRFVVPIWLAYGAVGDHKPSAAGTIYSDDGGKTWRAGNIAVPNKSGFVEASETMLAELSTGDVMLISRSLSKPNRKIVSTSPDGATKWSPLRFHPDLLEPICMASIVSYPLRSATLLFSNPHSVATDDDGKEIPSGRGLRRNLSIKLSNDDGATWPISKTIEAGNSAYSDLAVMSDGTVLCLYEANPTIVCARMNIDWIESP